MYVIFFSEMVLWMLCRNALHTLGGKSKKDCMLEYINKLLEIDEEWEEKVF